MSGTSLDITLSTALQTELEQLGVFAYVVNFDPPAGAEEWTPLAGNGTVAGGGSISIPLTNATTPTLNGGKIYFVVQSLPAGDPSTLPTDITMQSELNVTNAALDDFAYDSFEVTLESTPSDAGNLTAVNGFALPMSASVTYTDGSSASVGYNVTADTIVTDIKALGTGATYTYTEGPLNGDFRMSNSPAQADNSAPFLGSDWADYVDSLKQAAVAGNIIVSGEFNGAKDTSGVWHNGGFYSYTLTWDGTNFWLVPWTSSANQGAGSQIQGAIELPPTVLEDNIYSQTGTVGIYDSEGGSLVTTMLVGANNQWGAVLAKFLTGFTGGYYNFTATPQNPAIDTVDLDKSYNWDPDYAFGTSTTWSGTGTQPAQTSDPYSKIFYYNSNSYGSPYSDALMSQYTVGGPLLSVSEPGSSTNVSNIDLTIYAPGETPSGYTTPELDNFIPIPTSDTGYAVPDPATITNPATATNNIKLVFASTVLDNAGVILDSQTTITLRILISDTNGTPTWSSIVFDGSAHGGLWQNWQVGYDAGTQTYSATTEGVPQPAGSMIIDGFPTADSGVSWYQIVVGTGAAAKTFNVYVTTTDNGLIENPAYAGQSGALAVDGLAIITPQATTDQTIGNFTVDFTPSTTVAFDPSLLVPNTASTSLVVPVPDAPVAGMLSGQTFTALGGQTNDVSNTITTTETTIAFAWTGENSDPNTGSWISGYTNKINAGDTAQVTITASDGTHIVRDATAGLDGTWQTDAVTLAANKTYTVTMQEYLPSDTPFTDQASDPLTAESNALTLIIPCFRLGTRIATPDGEVRVEDLRAGDLVRTVSGRCAPIRWIGRRRVDCASHPEPQAVWPVRIAAGAFGRQQPHRTLFLSPDHAVFAEGVLVPVKYLINGTSITQVAMDTVTYVHLELDRHDVVFAEGLTAETYLDTGDRAAFENAPVSLLHPVWGPRDSDVSLILDALGYAPLRICGPEVDALRARLAAPPRAAGRRRPASAPAPALDHAMAS